LDISNWLIYFRIKAVYYRVPKSNGVKNKKVPFLREIFLRHFFYAVHIIAGGGKLHPRSIRRTSHVAIYPIKAIVAPVVLHNDYTCWKHWITKTSEAGVLSSHLDEVSKFTSKTVPGLLRYKRCKFSSKFTTVVNVVIVNFINFVKMVLNLVLNVVNLVL
jgi:hypothetical protein